MTLREAAMRGDLPGVQYLCEEAKIGKKDIEGMPGYTPLHCAAMNGHWNVVQYLLETIGVDNEFGDSNGSTPLHYAAFGGHLEVVKYLCEKAKVNKEATDNDGLTPLDLAVEKGYQDVKEYLLEQIAEKAKGGQEELQQQ